MRFSDVLGQEGSVKLLKARLKKGTGLDTSYIFAGGHGQGKTTLARILARAILCQNLQGDEPCNECDNCRGILSETSSAFSEMDAASRGTIDVARSIVDDIPFVIQNASKRVYLFDEAHRMSRDAQDVLLKPIEDKQLVAIFCTTEPEKIRGPIRSRCETYQIRKVTREDILTRMKWVLQQEGVEHEDDAVLTVIDYSGGHVRDILNRLEMVAQLGPVTLSSVREYLRLSSVATYYEILLSLGDPVSATQLVDAVCDEVDAEDVATGLAEAAMNSFRLANGMHADFSLVDKELAKRVYDLHGPKIVQLADYFLQDYKPSRVSLVCKVVRCAHGVPTAPAQAVSAPPVVVQMVGAPVVQPRAPELVPSPVVPEKAPVAASAPVVALPPPTPTAPAIPVAPPLTECDDKGIPQNLPRGTRMTKVTPIKSGGEPEYLTPEEWRREFESLLLQQRI